MLLKLYHYPQIYFFSLIRIPDNTNQKSWRIICRIDEDAIIIVGVFPKKTQKTPKKEIDLAKKRLKEYDDLINR